MPVDGAIQVAPAATDFQVRLIHVSGSATGTTLAATALPEFGSQNGGELRLPIANRLVAEYDTALEEHLAQVSQGQAVAQPPQHHQRDDVIRVLRPVQQPAAALVELLPAVAAAKALVARPSPSVIWSAR